MKTNLVEFILAQKKRLAMPIGIYSGLALTGKSVFRAVQDPAVQIEAQEELYKRYKPPFLQTAMDLSLEGEAFGCQVRFQENEIPTIEGRLVTSPEDVQTLIDAKPGHKRTTVPLTTVRLLKEKYRGAPPFVLGGMIGPFTLAGRLYGVSETLMLTMQDPDLLTALLKTATRFLIRYANAFRLSAADGILMAEPSAGLISPAAMARFSLPYIKQIIAEVQSSQFSIIYHNCGARLAHLPVVLEAGAVMYHFGKPMDIAVALQKVKGDVLLAGNLDPAEVFIDSSPDETYRRTAELLDHTAAFPNFVLSSGCDLPPGTPLPNLDAFYQALAEFNQP